jgi:hypothetical protein
MPDLARLQLAALAAGLKERPGLLAAIRQISSI